MPGRCAAGRLSGHATDRNPLSRRSRLRRSRWPGRRRPRSSRPAPASPSTRTRPRTPSGSSGPRHRARTPTGSATTTTTNNTLGSLSRSSTWPSASSGSSWANWSGVATLQHGGQYGICAQGQYRFPNDPLWISDGPNSCSMGTHARPARAHDDRPLQADRGASSSRRGAAFVKDAKVPVRVDFADDVAGPFPANFLCFKVGGGRATCATRAPATSTATTPPAPCPASGGKSTTFSCTADYGAVPDGSVWACVIAADASIPDNPNGPEPDRHGGEGEPVRSELRRRRGRPHAAHGLDRGRLDDGQGRRSRVAAGVRLGRHLGPGRRRPVDVGRQHRGRQRRRRHAHLHAARDLRGRADGRRRGGQHRDREEGDHGDRAADGTPPAAAGRRRLPPRWRRTTTPPPGGGGGTHRPGGGAPPRPTTPASASTLYAPRKARARAKSIPVELTASDAGRVQLALARGNRVIVRAGVQLDEDGTADYRLKLPKGSRAGRYTLQGDLHAARPPGDHRVAEAHADRQGVVPARARELRAPPWRSARGPRALPDGRFHGDRPARTFKVR